MAHDPFTDARVVTVGALLAGGKARRMGRDKRLLRLGGVNLVERNLALLRRLFPTVALSLRDRAQAPPGLDTEVEIVVDVATGSPLAGIATVLARFGRPVFVLAADVAFAEAAAVSHVLASFADADVTLPVVDGHLEPLHAVYGPGCLPPARRLLQAGAHSILDLLDEVRVAAVPFSSAAPFFNVNTPADWASARRRAGDRPGPSRGPTS